MISWLIGGTWIGRVALALIVVAGLGACAGLGFWQGAAIIDGWIEQAAVTARAECNAHWRAEIERSNAEVAKAQAAQAKAAMAAENSSTV